MVEVVHSNDVLFAVDEKDSYYVRNNDVVFRKLLSDQEVYSDAFEDKLYSQIFKPDEKSKKEFLLKY